ncbi:single-stranded DNA-binding protein [Thalassotalea litorea]|uniref:Single-stranded DNA-binding protein n=1 Tax=Thalassotalea litorea TaxID=2020715 RepID=A0A5R9IR67_9GAMM|nr:single-stranded DNA-binding protein [Thalassotalea litorea]TLU65716.1 single-stranded DNA-binding protein [Thalassotalea litorea]
MDQSVKPPKWQQCQVVLAGNLVAKPEVRYRANPATPVSEFVIATHQRWFDKSTNSYKDWTTYLTCLAQGESLEREFIHADKGQLVMLSGQLGGDNDKHLILTDDVSVVGKGLAQSINQLHMQATLVSEVKLMQTQNNATMAEFTVQCQQSGLPAKHAKAERIVHVFGKSAQFLADKAKPNQQVIIEASIAQQGDHKQLQLIDAKRVIICPE